MSNGLTMLVVMVSLIEDLALAWSFVVWEVARRLCFQQRPSGGSRHVAARTGRDVVSGAGAKYKLSLPAG